MLSCANLSPSLSSLLSLMVTLLWGHHWPAACVAAAGAAAAAAATAATATPAENDTTVVGSLVHLTKVAPPAVADMVGAGSKKHVDDFFNNDKFSNQGFKRAHQIKDNDGYTTHDTFHTKDGDGFGYAQHFEFDKKGGDKKSGGYHESSSYDDDDDDGGGGGGSSAAAGSMPKFSEWHFEQKSDSPAKSYRYEGSSDDHGRGRLVGPDYEESKGSVGGSAASRRSKRKKEPQPSATEYDNYEYADVEEPDDGAPADFEGDEGADPEYGALYADADAYDYY